jgi:uncharacterized phage protein gp47/JayE
MASSSSVPKIQFTESGVVIPSDADILEGVQTDIDSAFGGGLNPALETPQGQLASSQAAVISDKNSNIVYIANQIDPQFAEGRWQDALGRIYFLTRKPATSTTVTATIGGVVGKTVPAGSLAQDTSGNTYASTADATIGSGGTVSAEFANIETGPIACPSGTLTKVYQAVDGWDTITNAAAGVLGQDVESRANFEIRRKNSVALNSTGTPAAIYSAVFDVDDVLDVYVIDNPSGSPLSVGSTSFSVAAHSVYVCVSGGIDADVAFAIWSKKDVGCDYNGDTTVTVVDEVGYSYPEPEYDVTFQRPDDLPILFEVEIVDDSTVPANIEELVKAAILARFNGTDGTQRERIGATILASRYYSAIAVLENTSLLSVLIGTATATLTSIEVGVDQVPTLDADDITVTLV